jgi:transcriptional regulator with XRE-family HTH domain
MTIKEFRLSQKLSQVDFAAALGISVSTERSYEYGVREPNVKVIEKIKEVYGVDLNATETAVAEAAPILEKKPAVEEKPAKRGRKKKDATEAAPVPVVEEKVGETLAKPKRGRKKKEQPTPAPVDESLLKMQNDADAAVHALFDAKGTVIIQSPMGGEIDVNEILAKVGPVDKVYVRVDQNAAYWVRGDESGAVNLW